MAEKIREGIMQTAKRIVREYVQRGHINPQETQTPKKLRVAAYCRVSTDSEEQLNSYSTQVTYYTNYIKSKPEWEFVGIYADEGITGTSAKKRKEFMRMINDAMNGKIDLIIVKSVSRYARNTVDSLSNVRMLREKGVKIFFEKENIDSLDPKCDMILSIYSSLAEEESRSISTNIRWSVQKRFEKGKVIMCFNCLYGYGQDKDGNVYIKEDEAEVVRDIYFGFLIGKSYQNIVEELKNRNIPSPKGNNTWSKSTIKSMLQNEKYMGDAILQKTYKRDFLTQRRVKNTGQAPQRYVENNHPAIIDKGTWKAVRAELKRRNELRSVERTGKGRYNGQYAFSGKIVCGLCGGGFRRHNYINDNKKEYVWTCKQHVKSNKLCHQLPIKEEYLERIFVKTANKLISKREEILSAVKSSVKEAIVELDYKQDDDNLIKIDKEIELLQNEIYNLSVKRRSKVIDADTYNSESQKAMSRIDELFAQRDKLVELNTAASLAKVKGEIVGRFLNEQTKLEKFDRDVFEKLVEKVIIKGKDNIMFEFKDGTSLKAEIEL
jgi:site-specific DNA recombinase